MHSESPSGDPNFIADPEFHSHWLQSKAPFYNVRHNTRDVAYRQTQDPCLTTNGNNADNINRTSMSSDRN